MTIYEHLEYEIEGFPERARKLISAARPFRVVIQGRAKAALDPHLENGKVSDLGKLAMIPVLHPLLGVLAFADAKGRACSLEPEGDIVTLSVGAGEA